MKQYKTKKERLLEVLDIYRKLQRCGFPTQLEGIIELKDILRKWVNDGEYAKGRIKLPGYERIVHYELYTKQGIEIAVNLVYVKGL